MKFTQWILLASGFTSALLLSVMYQPLAVSQVVEAKPALLAQTATDDLPQLPQSTRVDLVDTPIQADVPARAESLVQANAAAGRTPAMTMSDLQGDVDVRIENMTDDAITYQALGDTEPRVLAANSETILSGLSVPATVTFSYEEIDRNRVTKSGLTQAEVEVNENGTLNLAVQATNDLSADASNLTIESGGNVFVF